jgi:hypothetical protein
MMVMVVMMMVVMMVMVVHHRLFGRLGGVFGESRRNPQPHRQGGGGDNDLLHYLKSPIILGSEDRPEIA